MANTGPGPSNPGQNTDASTNAPPIIEVDGKQPWSLWGSKPEIPGFYPDGIDAAPRGGFDLSVDNTGDNAPDTGLRVPASQLPPRMGARLSDLPLSDPRRQYHSNNG